MVREMPVRTPAQLGSRFLREYRDSAIESELDEILGGLDQHVDSRSAAPAKFALYAYAIYWGAYSSGLASLVSREIAKESVLAWTRERAKTGDWKEANEAAISLFNKLGTNLHAAGEHGEVYIGHLFLAAVLGDDHARAFDMGGAFSVYGWVQVLAGQFKSFFEGVTVASA